MLLSLDVFFEPQLKAWLLFPMSCAERKQPRFSRRLIQKNNLTNIGTNPILGWQTTFPNRYQTNHIMLGFSKNCQPDIKILSGNALYLFAFHGRAVYRAICSTGTNILPCPADVFISGKRLQALLEPSCKRFPHRVARKLSVYPNRKLTGTGTF